MLRNSNAENSKYISFDGTMKLNTQYELIAGNPVTLDNGFTYMEVDISEFKTISAVKVTEFNTAFPDVMIDTPNTINFNNYFYTIGSIIVNSNTNMSMHVEPSELHAQRNYGFPLNQNFIVLKMKLRPEITDMVAITIYAKNTIVSFKELIDIKELINNDFSRYVYIYLDVINMVAYLTTENKSKQIDCNKYEF